MAASYKGKVVAENFVKGAAVFYKLLCVIKTVVSRSRTETSGAIARTSAQDGMLKFGGLRNSSKVVAFFFLLGLIPFVYREQASD